MRLRSVVNAKSLAVAATAAGALLATVLPSSADVSAESPSIGAVRIESPAIMQARGAGLITSVTVVCTPGANAFVNAGVSQRVNNRIARGFGSTQFTCDGRAQTFALPMFAEDAPFHRGVAFGTASLFVSPNPGSIVDTREIQIVKDSSAP